MSPSSSQSRKRPCICAACSDISGRSPSRRSPPARAHGHKEPRIRQDIEDLRLIQPPPRSMNTTIRLKASTMCPKTEAGSKHHLIPADSDARPSLSEAVVAAPRPLQRPAVREMNTFSYESPPSASCTVSWYSEAEFRPGQSARRTYTRRSRHPLRWRTSRGAIDQRPHPANRLGAG